VIVVSMPTRSVMSDSAIECSRSLQQSTKT